MLSLSVIKFCRELFLSQTYRQTSYGPRFVRGSRRLRPPIQAYTCTEISSFPAFAGCAFSWGALAIECPIQFLVHVSSVLSMFESPHRASEFRRGQLRGRRQRYLTRANHRDRDFSYVAQSVSVRVRELAVSAAPLSLHSFHLTIWPSWASPLVRLLSGSASHVLVYRNWN